MTFKTVLVTGGAGFIGSHVVRLLVNTYPDMFVINADKLTYAGNLENLSDVEKKSNYLFVRADITSMKQLGNIFGNHKVDAIVHLAAESHVDRSISNPLVFVKTNITGTVNLMNLALAHWKESLEGKLFYHISTDEVFGSLENGGLFTENTAYDPRSPYSASKAGADHLVRAFGNTYKLPYIISNCSNNFGPNQFPEKLIPLAINNIKNNQPVPVYGKGENMRDWLYVEDHARAIDLILHHGKTGETYTIGGGNVWKNIDLLLLLCRIMDAKLQRMPGTSASLIRYVPDREGHDLRYAIDSTKIRKTLGWRPLVSFEQGLEMTVDWYLRHNAWLEHVINGSYKRYYRSQYLNR